jgi:hypothetical protein
MKNYKIVYRQQHGCRICGKNRGKVLDRSKHDNKKAHKKAPEGAFIF